MKGRKPFRFSESKGASTNIVIFTMIPLNPKGARITFCLFTGGKDRRKESS
jgi:hypothetical protein